MNIKPYFPLEIWCGWSPSRPAPAAVETPPDGKDWIQLLTVLQAIQQYCLQLDVRLKRLETTKLGDISQFISFQQSVKSQKLSQIGSNQAFLMSHRVNFQKILNRNSSFVLNFVQNASVKRIIVPQNTTSQLSFNQITVVKKSSLRAIRQILVLNSSATGTTKKKQS